MELLQADDGAVGAAAGVGDREVHGDIPRGEREIGVLEGGVVHLGVERKGRERVLAVLALDAAVDGDRAGGLHLLEVVGVDGGDQRQDVPELRAGRGEREVEGELLTGRSGGARDAELEVVEAELGGP